MPNADPKILAQQRFDNDERDPPDARSIIFRSTDVPAIIETIMDAVRPVALPGARIIELGFGGGEVLAELLERFPEPRLYGLDLSQRYVHAAAEKFASDIELLAGDMERLPFKDSSLDGIVTCWTLYFMRDLDASLAEFRRVLRPGGVFVTATNARDHMIEYTELARRAVRGALGRDMGPDIDIRFDINTGGNAVRRHFPDVALREWNGVLRISTVEEALLLWPVYGDWSVTDAEAPRVLDLLGRMAGETLARVGEIMIRRHGGAFIARL